MESSPICCRICHDDDDCVIQPCKCRGSLQYVHELCLLEWVNIKQSETCDICRASYTWPGDGKAELPENVKKLILSAFLGCVIQTYIMSETFQFICSYIGLVFSIPVTVYRGLLCSLALTYHLWYLDRPVETCHPERWCNFDSDTFWEISQWVGLGTIVVLQLKSTCKKRRSCGYI